MQAIIGEKFTNNVKMDKKETIAHKIIFIRNGNKNTSSKLFSIIFGIAGLYITEINTDRAANEIPNIEAEAPIKVVEYSS